MTSLRRALLVVAMLVASAAPLVAQGSPQEAPPPDSAGGLVSAIELADSVTDTTQATLTARERRSRRNMAVWLLESKLSAEMRTFARDQEKVTGEDAGAWAAGGWIRFRSGRWRDQFAFRASLYMSMRLAGDSTRDPSQILAPDYGNLVTLGVLNVEWYWKKSIFTVGRQDLSLPLVNKADTRMIPRTFMSVMGHGPISEKLSWVGGYIHRIKERDSDRFAPVSLVAGVPTGNRRGMVAAGLTLDNAASGHVSAGVYNYLVPDVHNLSFAEVTLVRNTERGRQFKMGLQAADLHTVGNLLPGAPYSSQFFAGRLAGSVNRVVASLAVSKTTYGAEFVTPYGLFPGYTSPMGTDFTRPGEFAWHVSGSYNLRRFSQGLTAFVGFGRASGGRDPASGLVFSRDELEVTLDYKPAAGSLKGFWFRARAMKLWQFGAQPEAHDIRFIGYYTVPIAWPPTGGR